MTVSNTLFDVPNGKKVFINLTPNEYPFNYYHVS